jgi:hypothetical protein
MNAEIYPVFSIIDIIYSNILNRFTFSIYLLIVGDGVCFELTEKADNSYIVS